MTTRPPPTLPRRLFAEALGTALLLAVVIGSGVMAERLAGGNVAVALLANTLATVFGLYVLIEVFGPVSGAHFNPAVSAAMAARGALRPAELAPYVGAQLAGAAGGAVLAHAMFELPLLQASTHLRGGVGAWIAEAVATGGLLLVILRAPAGAAAPRVAAYIGAAYWFTASTSFANPAAAFGRMLSDTFAGIAPASVPGFVVAQLAGAALGVAVHAALGSVDDRVPVAMGAPVPAPAPSSTAGAAQADTVTLRAATPADWSDVSTLLSTHGLPIAGAREHLQDFVVGLQGDRVAGVAGLEVHGDVALLRSVAVAADAAGLGIGATLVARLLDDARHRGVRQVCLLTTTAADWFPRFGFRPLARDHAPSALQASAEFQGACPASATLLSLDLVADGSRAGLAPRTDPSPALP